MKPLKDILYKVPIISVIGNTSTSINEVVFDSRSVKQNDVFVAIVGTTSNGHDYIQTAIKNGATSIICEVIPKEISTNITYIKVENSMKALAIIAANFYENPSEKLKLIGVTGTNGKTTVATLLYQLFTNAKYKTGLLSTVKIMINKTEYHTTHTTPDSLTINKYLAKMVKENVSHCFMEVSSHGIAQHRIDGLYFTGGIFTNLSHDHLDYHNSFDEYRDVKKTFFDKLPAEAFAITNIDDKNGAYILQNTKAKKYTYSLKNYANYKAKIVESQLGGMLLKINNQEVWTQLIGNFNAYNLLAVYATANVLGINPIETLKLISKLESVAGRFQYFISEKKITVIVDYAHTPDALQNVLETINAIRSKNEQLITVVGCGGDRDKEKRPKMAHIATQLSNKVILTSDNPRTENPETIIAEMEKGIAPENFKKTITITNRKQAIKTACQIVEPKDILLIAGKGHENYQEINGEKFPFNDYKIAKDYLNQLEK